MEKLLNYKEVAKATGLSVGFLKKARRLKDLPFVKIGRLTKFKLSEVSFWIDSFSK